MYARFRVTETGKQRIRPVRWPDDILIMVTEMCACADGIRLFVPALYIEIYNTLSPRLFEIRDGLNEIVSLDVGDFEMPSPSPELLTWVDVNILKDHKQINKALDRTIKGVHAVVDSMLDLPDGSPKYEAAKTLQSVWFYKGTRFLNYTGARQWVVTDRLFCHNTEKFAEAVSVLGIQENLTKIQLLNTFYGKVLNITTAKLNDPKKENLKEAQKDLIDSFHRLMEEYFSFANLVWPGSTIEDEARRMDLIGPYMNYIIKDSKKTSRKVKKALKKKKEDKDNSSDIPPSS